MPVLGRFFIQIPHKQAIVPSGRTIHPPNLTTLIILQYAMGSVILVVLNMILAIILGFAVLAVLCSIFVADLITLTATGTDQHDLGVTIDDLAIDADNAHHPFYSRNPK
jgi:hypothetical protein